MVYACFLRAGSLSGPHAVWRRTRPPCDVSLCGRLGRGIGIGRARQSLVRRDRPDRRRGLAESSGQRSVPRVSRALFTAFDGIGQTGGCLLRLQAGPTRRPPSRSQESPAARPRARIACALLNRPDVRPRSSGTSRPRLHWRGYSVSAFSKPQQQPLWRSLDIPSFSHNPSGPIRQPGLRQPPHTALADRPLAVRLRGLQAAQRTVAKPPKKAQQERDPL